MTRTPWWQSAVIYQIYPRSFQDSNGDGIGDIPGITSRLSYLVDLGIDAIWISPIFLSPMKDFGYDISDYTAIDPIFGTMNDFDDLLLAAHSHGLKVLLDFVPNHTSDQHPWFVASKSSRTDPKRDWYIWRDPASDGGPPNNWLSEFGGSAWEFDSRSGQYYYHAFLSSQPDLNWRNHDVVSAMHDVLRFWLRKGVDGFRVDVIWHLIKDDRFRDNPINPDYQEGKPPHQRVIPAYTTDLPEVLDVVAGLRRVIDEFADRLLIGEIYLPIERLVAYYGRNLDGTHLPFNFSLLDTPWTARDIADLIHQYEAALPAGGWPNWVLSNHDRPRIAGRVGPGQAAVAAMLLLTLRGTPTIYYGDEIGMPQSVIPDDQVRDPFEKNVPGIGIGRDGGRSPMQWDTTGNAGFSTAQPWLPLAERAISINVEMLRQEPPSILNLYKRLIAARRTNTALTLGSYTPHMTDQGLLIYIRQFEEKRVLVILNLTPVDSVVTFPDGWAVGNVLVSALGDRDHEAASGTVIVRADEGLVIDLVAVGHILSAEMSSREPH
jgi:alpha-glucosidase